MSKNGKFHSKIVGQSALKIAEMAGFSVNKGVQVLLTEVDKIGSEEPLSGEKFAPVLTMYRAFDYAEGILKAQKLIEHGGYGHVSAYYTNKNNANRINEYSEAINSGRVLVNIPVSHGSVGDLYNFRLEPSLSMGCEAYGSGAVCEEVGINSFMNIKTVVRSRESMGGYAVPPKVFFGSGSLSSALEDLKGKKRAFIITDEFISDLECIETVVEKLDSLGIKSEIFNEVEPNPKLSTVERAMEKIKVFQPDVFISIGGGSPIDAAKMMWLLYENPEQKFEDLSLRFMELNKRIYEFSKTHQKAIFVAIPTTSGTGSEVTPFAVITDDKTGVKYPLADYALLPDMAIVDPELVMDMPPGLTANTGLDALSHVLETYVSAVDNEFVDGHAIMAMDMIFEYLPVSYREGAKNELARTKMHYAATLAGIAFANSFLGICHSLAHKLGAAFDIPHGLSNAIMLPAVIRYNSEDVPLRQIMSPKYKQYATKRRYAEIAEKLNLGGKNDDEKVKNLIAAIEKLKADVEVPMRVRDLGISKEDYFSKIKEMAENAFDDQCTGANPRFPLIEEMEELYRQVW